MKFIKRTKKDKFLKDFKENLIKFLSKKNDLKKLFLTKKCLIRKLERQN